MCFRHHGAVQTAAQWLSRCAACLLAPDAPIIVGGQDMLECLAHALRVAVRPMKGQGGQQRQSTPAAHCGARPGGSPQQEGRHIDVQLRAVQPGQLGHGLCSPASRLLVGLGCLGPGRLCLSPLADCTSRALAPPVQAAATMCCGQRAAARLPSSSRACTRTAAARSRCSCASRSLL